VQFRLLRASLVAFALVLVSTLPAWFGVTPASGAHAGDIRYPRLQGEPGGDARAPLPPGSVPSWVWGDNRQAAGPASVLTQAGQAATRAYVTNNFDNTVTVIDVATNTVAATIPVGPGPAGIAMSPDGRRVFVANTRGGPDGNSVSVIDTWTSTEITKVSVLGCPNGIVVSPDSRTIYVTSPCGEHSVNVIRADPSFQNYTLDLPTIRVGDNPQGIAISPTGDRLYVANASGNSLSVVRTLNRTVIHTISLAVGDVDFPRGVAYSSATGRVYVSMYATLSGDLARTVLVVDPPGCDTGCSGAVTGSFFVGGEPDRRGDHEPWAVHLRGERGGQHSVGGEAHRPLDGGRYADLCPVSAIWRWGQ
jgi:YVTN family beta-propeller protein